MPAPGGYPVPTGNVDPPDRLPRTPKGQPLQAQETIGHARGPDIHHSDGNLALATTPRESGPPEMRTRGTQDFAENRTLQNSGSGLRRKLESSLHQERIVVSWCSFGNTNIQDIHFINGHHLV